MSAPNLLAENVRMLGRATASVFSAGSKLASKVLDRPSKRIALALFVTSFPLTAAIAAFTSVPSDAEKILRDSQTLIETPLSLPALEKNRETLTEFHSAIVRTTSVRRGDTLATVFSRLDIADSAAAKFLRQQKAGQNLFNKAGNTYLRAKIGDGRQLLALNIFFEGKNGVNLLTSISRTDNGSFQVSESDFSYEKEQRMAAGTVTTTLEQAALEQGIPEDIIAQVPIAFEKFFAAGNSVAPGDSFRVIYEQLFLNGEFVRTGKILVMSIHHDGKDIESFWADDGSRNGDYYSLNGKSNRLAFIRVPVDGAHISSKFMPIRRHPITGVLRPHMGTDFAAMRGNKIYASADGVVSRRAFNANGYGNYLMIRHDKERVSVYGHMSRIARGITEGTRVQKGQIIGYVGSTGLATGPHLHYELRQNGRQVNPMKAPFPEKDTLTQPELAKLLADARLLTVRLAMLSRLQTARPELAPEKNSVIIPAGVPAPELEKGS